MDSKKTMTEHNKQFRLFWQNQRSAAATASSLLQGDDHAS
jgi:hypothetical protein